MSVQTTTVISSYNNCSIHVFPTDVPSPPPAIPAAPLPPSPRPPDPPPPPPRPLPPTGLQFPYIRSCERQLERSIFSVDAESVRRPTPGSNTMCWTLRVNFTRFDGEGSCNRTEIHSFQIAVREWHRLDTMWWEGGG